MLVSGVLQILLKVNDTYDSFSIHIHIICSKFKIYSAWKIKRIMILITQIISNLKDLC